MEKWKRRSVDLLTSLIFGGRENMSVVPYYPQKTRVCNTDEYYFGRTIPEKKGISSRRLYHMLCELEGEKRANIHSITVLRGGEVVCECYSPGYSFGYWHVAHSMSKTVCGMVVGCLCDAGVMSLDMKIADIFPEIKYKDRRFPLITVKHLLTMTCGIEFREPGVVTESDWTSAFFGSSVRFTPGARFDYNSMNSYILARAAERLTGKSFCDLVKSCIFAPLKISNYMWEIGPEGTEKGGWGLYMSSESWLKLGYMLLQGGVFSGKRILSESWVRQCRSAKAIAPKENGNFNYSYHIWVGRNSDELLFSGMLGQAVWICPKNDLVVVMSGGNNELFAASPALEIVRKYLGGRLSDRVDRYDSRLLAEKQSAFFSYRKWAYPLEQRQDFLTLVRLRSATPFNSDWTPILGEYILCNNGVGMMPLVLRVMQNNFGAGLQEIAFERRGELLYLEYTEGGDDYSIPIGFYGYKESVIRVRGEEYLVRAIGEAINLPSGREYRIEIIFPETASTRRIQIIKAQKGKIKLKLSETPGERLLQDYLAEFSKSNGAISLMVEILERRFGRGIVAQTVTKTFNPTLIGVDKSDRSYKKLLDEENKRIAKEQSKASFIRAIVDRFFKENE